eukprot:gene24096-30399_t
MYNLLDSYKMADVWKSSDGAAWTQEELLEGDFFAQNIDVVQPGAIAPWFQRYGHSLDAIDIDGDGEDDLMLLTGGFSSAPSNDLWVSNNGKKWMYCGQAPWSPRAWHATTVFQGHLWMMGGTPLNNEVWRLDSVTLVSPRTPPLTRSLYSNETYSLQWTRYPDAPWSPRVGSQVLSHFYFNTSNNNETIADTKERLVLAGGYGGWLEENTGGVTTVFDGYSCRADTWETYDGITWRLLNANNAFGSRAWFGMAQQRGANPAVDPYNSKQPPKMYILGGGYIGYSTSSIKQVNAMVGKADAYWSRDGIVWTKINYEEGGGTSTVPFFSSQEWSSTIVDTKTKYIGMWGLTVASFNTSSGVEDPGDLVLIAGDYTGAGDFSEETYISQPGLHCDTLGVICSGWTGAKCGINGCICPKGTSGSQCEIGSVGGNANGAMTSVHFNMLIHVGVLVSASVWLMG